MQNDEFRSSPDNKTPDDETQSNPGNKTSDDDAASHGASQAASIFTAICLPSRRIVPAVEMFLIL